VDGEDEDFTHEANGTTAISIRKTARQTPIASILRIHHPQEALAALRQAIKPAGVAGLKAAMHAMGRDCGALRPPLELLDAAKRDQLAADMNAISALRAEPRGW
jgi:dihydrodipicolinate synthase/N-acetylneuraminate lyase